jgi:hypothetical protein
MIRVGPEYQSIVSSRFPERKAATGQFLLFQIFQHANDVRAVRDIESSAMKWNSGSLRSFIRELSSRLIKPGRAGSPFTRAFPRFDAVHTNDINLAVGHITGKVHFYNADQPRNNAGPSENA